MKPKTTDDLIWKHSVKKSKLYLLLSFSVLMISQTLWSQKSIHQEQLEYYNNLGKVPSGYFDSINDYVPSKIAKVASSCSLEKIVYGFWPFWGGSTYTGFDWNLLSDLVYFSYEINPSTGAPVSVHDWSTSAAIDEALAHNVRVSLCANLFGSHTTFLSNSDAQQHFITTAINLLKNRGGKGVCIDFEGVSTSHREGITAFMKSLALQVHAAIPGSIITICLPAVEWSDKFDVSAMHNYVDYFVLMGYDYYYSGSTQAGPVGPLYSMTSAFNYNLNRSVITWINKGIPEEKFILGLPYYGREWTTVSSAIPSNTTGSSSSRTIKYIRDNSSGFYSDGNKYWNNSSFTPYYVFYNSEWRQCFIDDELSMGKRLDLINQRNLAGMGIWALGYDDGYSGYWTQIREKLSTCKTYPATDSVFDSGGPEQNYYSNDNYSSTIYAPQNTSEILLSFSEFKLQDGADSLFIYYGNNSENLIGGYTGSNSPGNIVIEGNSFSIRVKNDKSVTDKGWKATWRAQGPVYLEDFEIDLGHFSTNPSYSGSSEGISPASLIEHHKADAHLSTGSMKVILEDDAESEKDWLVRLLSAVGAPSNNIPFYPEGTLSFWMKSLNNQPDATVEVWIDDSDGLEISPALTVISDGLWHQYLVNLSDFNGSAYAGGNGNGFLDGPVITLDAIVFKNPDSTGLWTLLIDDLMYNPELHVNDSVSEDSPVAIYPVSGASVFELPVEMSWSFLTGEVDFVLQISQDINSWSKDTGFGTLVFSKHISETTSFTWTNAIRGNTYYWSIQAIYNDGQKSEFSKPQSFTVEQTIITLDNFEINSGHFDNHPTFSGSTVGINSSSSAERVTSSSYGGIGSLQIKLQDDPDSDSDWFVRLLSAEGNPSANSIIHNFGTLTFWLKTESAINGAKVQLWIDDSDGLETTVFLPVTNDGRWHKYSFDLKDIDQSSAGNGILNDLNITLDAIVLKQPDTDSEWTVFLDDVEYDAGGTGTKVIQSGTSFTKEVHPENRNFEPVVYPNPTNGTFAVEYTGDENYTIEVLNISGVIVYSSQVYSSVKQFDLESFPAGMYLLKIKSKQKSSVIRILINH